MSDARPPLSKYQSMRDFRETPEPAGALGPIPPPSPEGARFVIQEHHATSLHWDLRLERDGVLVSWALPKGIPPDPRVNHLAVHTEDHPLQYLTFHGDIPSGNYGAGTMTIWDTGTYETEKWDDREVIVVVHGSRAHGRYVLFGTRGNQWMIHRMDPPEDPGREVWPGWSAFEAMLAVPGEELPSGPFGFEIAWCGERALTYVSGGRVQVKGGLLTRFPELRALGPTLGVTEVVLDGELIVLGDGRPSPELLADRSAVRSDSTARRLANRRPATYMIYDLLWLDGHSAMPLAFSERRRLLEGLEVGGGGSGWQVAPVHVGEEVGPALLDAARQQGLPGVIAKRLDSPYRGGPAEGDWIFVPA